MTAGHDLEVDTGWIRQSAATVEDTGRRFASAASGIAPTVATGSLGSDAGADAVARLVGLRCGQGKQAADQLAAVAAGVSQQLTLAADTFDRLETGIGGPR